MAKINGQETPEASGLTIKDYLLLNNYKLSYIAVEVNGNIIPKTQYETYIIRESDTLEVVSFVGGG